MKKNMNEESYQNNKNVKRLTEKEIQREKRKKG